MTGKQMAAMSMLSAVVAAGAAVTGCSRGQMEDVKDGRGFYDPTTLEFRDNTSRTIPETELPPDVQALVHQQFPQGTVTGSEERRYLGGQTYYRVHVATGDGANRVEKTMDYNSGAGR